MISEFDHRFIIIRYIHEQYIDSSLSLYFTVIVSLDLYTF